MEAVASGVTVVSAGIGISKAIRDIHEGFQDLDKQIKHVNGQGQQLRMNRAQLSALPKYKTESIRVANEALEDIEVGLPTDLRHGRKRDRLKWLWSQKDESMRAMDRLKNTESSMILNMLIRQCEDIDVLKTEVREQQLEVKSQLRFQPHEARVRILLPYPHVREQMGRSVHQWIVERFGIMARVIRIKGTWDIHVRLRLVMPFVLGQVISGRLLIRDSIPSLMKWRLAPQNVIPASASIITACQIGDISQIRTLLNGAEAHPNDRTSDNITVFRHAIRAGNPEVVQLLLSHGADPNLTFGEFETSPLDNAFLIGNVAIIRLLLKAGGDLEYKNLRFWTPLSFLWDSSHPPHDTTSEILEICMERAFSAWNDVDKKGWSAVHRAGAYGCAEDIYNLSIKGANLSVYTTDLLWGPVMCAAREGNISTFDAFVDLLPREELIGARDTRGWSLLHFAAKKGSEPLMWKLINIGVAIDSLTMPTNYWVTERLAGRRLTAELIAEEYGYGELWDKIMTEFGGYKT